MWQELLPIDQLQPSALPDLVQMLTEKFVLMDDEQVLKYSLLQNCLPIGKLYLINP